MNHLVNRYLIVLASLVPKLFWLARQHIRFEDARVILRELATFFPPFRMGLDMAWGSCCFLTEDST